MLEYGFRDHGYIVQLDDHADRHTGSRAARQTPLVRLDAELSMIRRSKLTSTRPGWEPEGDLRGGTSKL